MTPPNHKDCFSPERLGGGKASSAAMQYYDSTTRTTCKSQECRKFDEIAVSAENADSVNSDCQVARSHKTSRNVAGLCGKLELMSEMPIDTLHEVFRHLDPIDLLHLSWASKTLRALIMERSARYIWQEAFERLHNPPPHCPEDIDITKYTRFLFKMECMMCGISNGDLCSWPMRLRTCSNCVEDHFTQCSFAPQYIDKLPSTIIANNRRYFLKRDIKDAEENGYSADKLENRLHGSWSFNKWRRTELKTLELERKRAILQKLEEIGWKQSDIENIAGGGVPSNLPGLEEAPAKKLTNKDWQEIKPRILKYLVDLKEHRDSANRWFAFNKTFTTWDMSQTSYRSFLPCPVDIAVLEPFRSTLFSSDAEMAEFDIDEIDRTAKEWMRRRDTLIFSLLPKDIQDRYRVEDIQLSPLHSLVILQFSLGPRLMTGTIDQICRYRHYASCSGDLQDPSDGEISGKLLAKHCRYKPWTWDSQYLSFDAKAFEIGKDTITFLGLDPYTTTFGNLLLQCHRRFICSGKHPPGFIPNELIGVRMLEHDCNLHEENWTPAAVRWRAV